MFSATKKLHDRFYVFFKKHLKTITEVISKNKCSSSAKSLVLSL